MREIVQKRTLTTKCFRREDGKNVYRVHLDHIHFEDAGELKEINALLNTVNGKLKPTRAGFGLDIPVDISNVGFIRRKLQVNFTPLVSGGVSIESINTGIRKIVTFDSKPSNNEVDFDLSFNGNPEIYYNDESKLKYKFVIREYLQQLTTKRLGLEANGQFKEARAVFEEQKLMEKELFWSTMTKWDEEQTVEFSGKMVIKLGDDEVFVRNPLVWDANNKMAHIKLRLSVVDGEMRFTKILPIDFLENAVYPVKTDATTSYYVGAGDGAVGYSNATWSTCRGAATGSFNFDTATTTSVLATTGYEIDRMFLPTDTSGITDTDTIDSASLKLYTTGKVDANSDSLYVLPTSQASSSALENTDYGSITFTDYGHAALSTFSNSAYNTINLNATGLSAISKTGITYIGVTMGRDFNNTAPTGNNNLNVAMSETSGTSQDPYLEVVTSPSSTAYQKDVTDTLSLTASLVKVPVKVILSGTLTMTSSVLNSAGKVVSNTIATTTSIVNHTLKVVSAGTITTTTNITSLVKKLKEVLDTINPTTTISSVIGRIVSNTINTTTLLSNHAGKVISGGTLTITSTITTLRSATKLILDTISATDSISRTFVKVVIDTINPITSLTKVFVSTVLAGTVTTTTSILKTTSKAVSDIITSTGSILRGISSTIVENLTITDSIQKLRGAIKTTTDTITSTTSITTLRTIIKSVTDSIDLTDSITKLRTAFKVISETISTTASLDKLITAIKSVTDTITTTTSITKLRTAIKSVVDTIKVLTPTRLIYVTINSIIINLLWRNRTKPNTSWTKRTKPTSVWRRRDIP